jgi:hypothetical protein
MRCDNRELTNVSVGQQILENWLFFAPYMNSQLTTSGLLVTRSESLARRTLPRV